MQIKPSIHLLVLGAVWLLFLGFISYGVAYTVNLPKKDPDKVLEIEQKVTEFFEKITLPIKIAKLSSQERDQELLMPILGKRVSDIADTWGAPRGEDRLHEGQDIFASRGTPIFSATNGYVTRINENNLGGNSVYVTGAGGVRYYYTHLDRFPDGLSVGEWVTPDTVIGFVGNTGNAVTTPYHLHFGDVCVARSGGPAASSKKPLIWYTDYMNRFILKIIVAAMAGLIIGLFTKDVSIGLAMFGLLLLVAWTPLYINYAKDNPQHLWFKRKLFGWGWTPVSWQGWAVIVIYIALVWGFALTIDENSSAREKAFTFFIPAAILTSLLIRICYRKGESPKWQWGKDLRKYDK